VTKREILEKQREIREKEHFFDFFSGSHTLFFDFYWRLFFCW
jgi:hypothetical protein